MPTALGHWLIQPHRPTKADLPITTIPPKQIHLNTNLSPCPATAAISSVSKKSRQDLNPLFLLKIIFQIATWGIFFSNLNSTLISPHRQYLHILCAESLSDSKKGDFNAWVRKLQSKGYFFGFAFMHLATSVVSCCHRRSGESPQHVFMIII